jgi:hypothetical protein
VVPSQLAAVPVYAMVPAPLRPTQKPVCCWPPSQMALGWIQLAVTEVYVPLIAE